MIRVGTSGWLYRHWRGPFYPSGLPQADWLSFYANRLPSVEINSTFYGLPAPKSVVTWRETVPDKFLFAVKANSYITHMKHLKDPQEPLSKMFARLELLEAKLGPILFQLPGKWRPNIERLRSFLEALPTDHQYAFEFRHPAWFDPRVYEALAEHGVGFCIYQFGDTRSPKQVTGDIVYVRLHGPDGPYQGCYSTPELAQWAADLRTWEVTGSHRNRDVYCYFDNDQAGYAVRNALELQTMLNAATT